jgi:hypothetical protein
MAHASEKYLPWVYEDYKRQVSAGIANGISDRSRLILYGRLFGSAERDEISQNQFDELEGLLGIDRQELVDHLDSFVAKDSEE